MGISQNTLHCTDEKDGDKKEDTSIGMELLRPAVVSPMLPADSDSRRSIFSNYGRIEPPGSQIIN